jgi:hypothetical protein
MFSWCLRFCRMVDRKLVILAFLVILAVVSGVGPRGLLRAQGAVAIESTLDARYLNSDDIGTAKDTDMFIRVVGDGGSPISGASVQWISSEPGRISIVPMTGVTSAQGSATTHLAAQPRAARGPVTITTRVTLPNGGQFTKVDTVFIAGSLSRLAPLTSPLTLSGPGDRQKLVVSLLDATGQPSADGVPVAFSITTQNPLNVVTFVEMPGPFVSIKSKEGRAEITVQANQLGSASIRIQANSVVQEMSVFVGAVATPTITPSPTVAPTVVVTPSATVTPTVSPVLGTWDPLPQGEQWALSYWRAPDAPIESAAQNTSATSFWVLRNENGAIRFLGYSKQTPQASDIFTIQRGEAAFIR